MAGITNIIDGRATPSVRKPAVRTVAVNAALLLTTVVVTLFLAEAGVRYLLPQQLIIPRPELYKADNIFGWRHVANADTTINTGEGLVRIETDERGYRVTAPPLRPGAVASARILMLGDSFLEATAVSSEQVVSGELARKLTAALGLPALVDNTGVGGWDPNHYLLEAKRALAESAYDLGIVLLYVGNDIVTTIVDSYPARQPSQRHGFRFPRNLSSKEFVDAVLYPINDSLETRSHLFQLVKNGLQMPLAKLGLTANYFPPIFQLEEMYSKRWDNTTSICERIEQEFARHGIPAIFVLIPTPYQVDPQRFASYVRAFNIDPTTVDLDLPSRLLGDRFGSKGMKLVDPLRPMREKKQQGVDLYGRVDGHLNAAGHEMLANLLLPTLMESLKQRGIEK